MLARLYRYHSISNYLLNRWRFKNLRCGRNVIINLCPSSQFSYEAGSWLAEGTRIEIFNSSLSLSANVNICRQSQLSPGKSGIYIGKRSRIQEGARLIGEICIGDDVIIAPNFYMSSGIHVFNQDPHLPVAVQDRMHNHYAEPCVIEDDVWIGINVCVMPGVKIRRGCIIGAGAVVTRSTEAYGIYGGVPAKKIGSRLKLEAKTLLEGDNAHDLPYFYKGFDHFNYCNYQSKHHGVMTSDSLFSIYNELPAVNNMQMFIHSQAETITTLTHHDKKLILHPGENNILIDDVEIIDKLIHFKSTDYLIIQKIIFNV